MPSQRFSRSQGFTPPAACRPCFMPVPPLGFHPSRSISVRRASDLSAFLPSCGRLLFPSLSPSISLPRALRFCSLLRSGLRDDSAQSECPTPGLFSLRSSVSLGRLLHLTQGPRPSWAFPPQGSIPLHPRPSQAPVLSRASPGPSRKIFPAAPQSFFGAESSARLSRARPPLSRFPTLRSFPALRSASASGLPLRGCPVLPPSYTSSSKLLPHCRSSQGPTVR